MERRYLTYALPLFCAFSMLVLIGAVRAYRIEDAVAQEASPPAQSPTKKPDDTAREKAFWESADYFNKVTDYNAYLAIFPNGPHAQMAKDRVAALSAPAPAPVKSSSPVPAPDAQAEKDRTAALASASIAPLPASPPVSSTAETRAALAAPKPPQIEIGTLDTEQALNLTAADRIDVQQRLHTMQLYNGHIGGDFDAGVRSAIAEWQKHHDFAPTGELGPQQLAALRLDSEEPFQKLATSATKPTHHPRQIVRHVALRRQAAPTVSIFEVLKEQVSGKKKPGK